MQIAIALRFKELLLAVAVLCAGCAQPLLYNQARDKQGQDAKQAATDVNLVATVDALQAKFKALSALEVDTQKARRSLSRDLLMAELAAATPARAVAAAASAASVPAESVRARYVGNLIERRFTELVGMVPTVAKLESHVQTTSDAAADRQFTENRLRILSVSAKASIPSCRAARELRDAIDASPPDKPVAALTPLNKLERLKVTALLRDTVRRCEAATERPGIEPDSNSDLAVLTKARDDDRKALAGFDHRLRQKRMALENAVKLANAEEPGKSAGERLQAAAKKLEDQLKELRTAATEHDLQAFTAAQAQARLDALDTLLKAVGSGTTDLSTLGEDDRRAVLVVRLIPSVADEIQRAQQKAERIRLAPLILAKDHQRLVVEGFAAQRALLDRRAALRQQVLDSAHAEYGALARARIALDDGKIDLNAPLSGLLDGGGEATKRFLLLKSLAAFFDEAEQHRLDRELGELAADATGTEMAIEASRSAALQWQNLASGIAAVLGDYHAAGVKPSDIAEFLKAFGLIHIGSNVGR